jgi:hypothetical protein
VFHLFTPASHPFAEELARKCEQNVGLKRKAVALSLSPEDLVVFDGELRPPREKVQPLINKHMSSPVKPDVHNVCLPELIVCSLCVHRHRLNVPMPISFGGLVASGALWSEAI